MNTAERQLTKKEQIAAASDALIAIFDKPHAGHPELRNEQVKIHSRNATCGSHIFNAPRSGRNK
jgi:hypothetical protein